MRGNQHEAIDCLCAAQLRDVVNKIAAGQLSCLRLTIEDMYISSLQQAANLLGAGPVCTRKGNGHIVRIVIVRHHRTPLK